MSTYLCSPRAHWFRDAFEPARLECAAVGGWRWISNSFQSHPTVQPPPSVPADLFSSPLSAADVERIARRAAELVVEMLRAQPVADRDVKPENVP